jgi:hypothetical protein
MANAFINVGILVASILPLVSVHKENNPNTQTHISLAVGSNTNAEGSVPHVAVWGAGGQRITQYKGDRNGHIGGDKAGPTLELPLDNYQNGGKPAQPEYVTIVMQEKDAICLGLVVASTQLVQWSWTGDIGYTCGAQWYPSQLTMGSSDQPLRCVWLDADHSSGIIAKGLSLHIRDFSGDSGLLAQYTEDDGRLCKNTARMTFWPEIVPDDIPPFFSPPLQYQMETNGGDPTKPSTAGAVIKANQGIDRKTRAYPDGANLGGHKFRSRHARDVPSRQSLKIRGIKNYQHDRLTVSHLPGHSAKEVCEHEMSLGPDFVSMEEGLFCDMETATLWPLCDATQTIDCFNLETQLVQASGKKRNALIPKKYNFTDEWKEGRTR